MIPQQNALESIEFEEMPSLTYKMDFSENKIVKTCDNLEAMKQAIYKILNTERYDCLIYSWNYGVELKDLIGKPTNFCILEIERRIREALLQDDRISNVYDFQFEIPQKGIVHAAFIVDTIHGTLQAEKEVYI